MGRSETAARVRGLGLVECLIAVVILGILSAAAAPNFSALLQRHRMQALAQELLTDLRLARSEALRMSRTVKVSVRTDADSSCYAIHLGAPASCLCQSAQPQADRCAEMLIKQRWIPGANRLKIVSSSPTLHISPELGLTTSTASIQVQDRHSADGIRHVISLAGRIRSCAVGTSNGSLPLCAGPQEG